MRKKRGPDDTRTVSVPPPPPVPRELQTERSLLLQLHERLDILTPQLDEVGVSLRSVVRELSRVSETLIEHDRAWFTCMNFLEAEARTSGANGRAELISGAIDARRAALSDVAHDEPTSPGDR